MSDSKNRGPRAKRGEIREKLLKAARRQFSEKSFNSVTVKDIAEEAQVDPGLVAYYFGGKTGLFRESMSLPRDPSEIVMQAVGRPAEGAGRRILTALFEQWNLSESSESAGKLLIASLLESPETLATFQTWLSDEIIAPAANIIGGKDAHARATVATGIIFQILSLRFLLQIEPIASMSESEIIDLYAPILDNILTN